MIKLQGERLKLENTIIVNLAGLSSLAYQPVLGGLPPVNRIVEWARSVPMSSDIVFLTDSQSRVPDTSGIFSTSKVITRDVWTEEELVQALFESVSSEKPPEALFYVWGDAPLMDPSITSELWNIHYRYDADYTFADGYPYGITPEIFAPDFPERLKKLAVGRNNPPVRDTLFEILRQDINAFDVETHLSPEDLRMDRVSLTCDTRRNRNIMEAIYAIGGTDADSLCKLIPENRDLLRNLPSYFPIQVTDCCPQACSYCPFSKTNPMDGTNHMTPDRFNFLCQKIVDFAGDAVISPSLWGEPASHPKIGEILKIALGTGKNQQKDSIGIRPVRVLVETSGLGWDKNLLEKLAADGAGEDKNRLMWVVSLDASDPDLYRSLRGEGQKEAEETARLLTNLFKGQCWIQGVRMNENEEHLETFYKFWTDNGASVIIQKYNSYSNLLPQRNPADLSPLQRFPCWHLKRDMPILIDGSVPICQVDSNRRKPLGNAFRDELETIWRAGAQLHKNHVQRNYPEHCLGCDEYYTFNF